MEISEESPLVLKLVNWGGQLCVYPNRYEEKRGRKTETYPINRIKAIKVSGKNLTVRLDGVFSVRHYRLKGKGAAQFAEAVNPRL